MNYCSAITAAQITMIVTLTMGQFSVTVACIGQGSCSCSGTGVAYCPCTQQAPEPLSRSGYAAPPSQNFLAPVPSSYPPSLLPANLYGAVNSAPIPGISGGSYPQMYNIISHINDQSHLPPPQPVVSPVPQPLPNARAPAETPISSSGIYDTSVRSNVYGLYPRRVSTISLPSPAFTQDPSEQPQQQVEVAPAATYREFTDEFTEDMEEQPSQFATISDDSALTSQNIVTVPHENVETSKIDENLETFLPFLTATKKNKNANYVDVDVGGETYQSPPTTTQKSANFLNVDKGTYRGPSMEERTMVRTRTGNSTGDSRIHFHRGESYVLTSENTENSQEESSSDAAEHTSTEYTDISVNPTSTETRPISVNQSSKETSDLETRTYVPDPKISKTWTPNTTVNISSKTFDTPTYKKLRKNLHIGGKEFHIYNENLPVKNSKPIYGQKNLHNSRHETKHAPRAQPLPFLNSPFDTSFTGRRAVRVEKGAGARIFAGTSNTISGTSSKSSERISHREENASQRPVVSSYFIEDEPTAETVAYHEISSGNSNRRNNRVRFAASSVIRTGIGRNGHFEADETSHYMTYYHQTCTGRMLYRSHNETVPSAAEKCADLECDAANARILPNGLLEVVFLKDIDGRYKDLGSHCVSRVPVKEINFEGDFFGADRLLHAPSKRLYDQPLYKVAHRSKVFKPIRRVRKAKLW